MSWPAPFSHGKFSSVTSRSIYALSACSTSRALFRHVDSLADLPIPAVSRPGRTLDSSPQVGFFASLESTWKTTRLPDSVVWPYKS